MDEDLAKISLAELDIKVKKKIKHPSIILGTLLKTCIAFW
jgi:hypothetical protein